MSFGSADVSRRGKRGNNPFTSMRVEALKSFSSEGPPTLADDIKKLREAGLNVIDGTEPGTVMLFFHGIRPGNGLSEDEQEVPAPPHRKPN